MAYYVCHAVGETAEHAVKRLQEPVVTSLKEGWECQGGVSLATYELQDSESGEIKLFFTASQAMVKRTGAAQEGGRRTRKSRK
jgi:hypothetical protein